MTLTSMPAVAFGTYPLKGDACAQAVAMALGLGYRHLDTAEIYGNEVAVGQGLRAARVARDDVFLTTKVWHDGLSAAELPRRVEASLARLGVDAVDLLLVHWPNPASPLAETLNALADVKRRGLARRIGVSNFPSAMLRQAVRLCPEPIFAVQVEHHPFLRQAMVEVTARELGIQPIAYSPLAQGLVARDLTLLRIADATGRSPAQVALRWLTQRGWAVAPKSADPVRAAANLACQDFDLSPAQMAEIGALTSAGIRTVNHAFAPVWDAA
jgi:2,5-diketo-D-gluconate reductase B